MQNREAFLSHGGEAFDYVPCLNSSDAQVDLYDRVVTRHTQGWPDSPAKTTRPRAGRVARAGARARRADLSRMLGRFLEVSIHAPDVPASLEFYESLGFVQAAGRRHLVAPIRGGHRRTTAPRPARL